MSRANKKTGPKRAVLVGIAGSHDAFNLSLYNLKAYVSKNPDIYNTWDITTIQHPFIAATFENIKIPQLVNKISAVQPDLVAFSCYMWNANAFRKIAKNLRQRLPETCILWGGPEIATDYLQEGKFNDFEMNFCISGEGELSFLELLKNLTYGSPKLSNIPGLSYREAPTGCLKINQKRTQFKSLEEIPSPFLTGQVDDEVLLRPGIEVNIETQRGCSLRCSYCVYHKDMNRIRYADTKRTIDEISYLINKGVKKIRFVDANFTSNLDHAKAIMRGLIERKIESRLMFELIPGFIDEEITSLFAQFNDLHPWNEITLGIGVQSINLNILKKVHRAIRIEKFEKTFELIQKYNLYAKIDVIIGLPGENIASIERTLDYMLNKLRHSQAHLLCCHVMRGLPGTELLKTAQDHGMIFSSKYEPHEMIESPDLPRRDMLKCLRRTAVIFRLINHEGWANREFIADLRSKDVSIREAFFNTRDQLNISNIQLVDLIIDELMNYLGERNSWFTQPEFPYAETWWWVHSVREISNEWLLNCLNNLECKKKEIHV